MKRFSDFDPAISVRLEQCVGNIRSQLAGSVSLDEVEEVIDLISEYLAASVEAGMTAGDVETLCDSVERDSADFASGDEPLQTRRHAALENKVAGVPIGLVDPASTLASRWWDPRSPRIFVPRLLGIGWDLNFGAIAVRLGLIQPDSEDEPFALVPQRVHALGSFIPILIAFVNIFVLWVFSTRLPAALPVHFGLSGLPDRWGGFWEAFTVPLIVTIVPAGYAAISVILRRSAIGRAVSVAFALMLGSIGTGVTFASLLAVSPASLYSRYALFGSLIAALVIPLLYLTCMSRIGMRNEIEGARAKEKGVANV